MPRSQTREPESADWIVTWGAPPAELGLRAERTAARRPQPPLRGRARLPREGEPLTRDLLALAVANACLVAAGHGVLRRPALKPALDDLPGRSASRTSPEPRRWACVGSALLVAGLSLAWWQLVLLCAGVFAAGFARRGELRRPRRVPTRGLLRVFPIATGIALAILALDLAVQPIWTDDAWSIWAIKATSIVETGGLDPEFLSSAAVFNADYPLVRAGARARRDALLPVGRRSWCPCSSGSSSSPSRPRSSRSSVTACVRSSSGRS